MHTLTLAGGCRSGAVLEMLRDPVGLAQDRINLSRRAEELRAQEQAACVTGGSFVPTYPFPLPTGWCPWGIPVVGPRASFVGDSGQLLFGT